MRGEPKDCHHDGPRVLEKDTAQQPQVNATSSAGWRDGTDVLFMSHKGEAQQPASNALLGRAQGKGPQLSVWVPIRLMKPSDGEPKLHLSGAWPGPWSRQTLLRETTPAVTC